MRTAAATVVLAILLAITGCSGEDPTMPDVTGERLDAAKAAIESSGVDDDVEVDGGGMFGVIQEANWVVCDQRPAAGDPVTGPPQLVVDRSCGEEEEEPTEEPSATEEPTEEPSTTEEPTEEPSAPEEPEVITARNDRDFGALLKLTDYCAPAIKDFAREHAGQKIQFDGAIVAMANHGSYDTRYDILMNAGDFDPNTGRGPSFKYEDVAAFDLEFTGKVPNRFGYGDEFTFTATIDRYVPKQCLFYLDPISTRAR